MALCAATSAPAQEKALPVEAMSAAQRADHRRLLRDYRENFSVLGVARRHGADSEPVRVAGLVYKAAAENTMLGPELDPAPLVSPQLRS